MKINDEFYTFLLEDNLILSDKGNRFIVLNQKGKFLWEALLMGESKDDVIKHYKEGFDLSDDETDHDIDAFFDLVSSDIQKTKNPKKNKIQKNLTPYTPVITKKYRVYGKTISFHIKQKELENLIEPVIYPWREDFSGPSDIEIDFLKDEDNSYAFYINRREVVESKDFYYVRGVALYEIMAALFPDKKWISVFHGAILKIKNHVILFSGKSGVGKSTLSAYLVNNGYEFLSDDMILLDRERNIIETPYAISLKQKSWELLSPFMSCMDKLPIYNIQKGRAKYYSSNKGKRDMPYVGSPDFLCLIQYRDKTEVEIKPITKTDAFIRLIDAGAWVSHDYNDLEIFINWIQNIPSYELLYSDLSKAKEALDKILENEYNKNI